MDLLELLGELEQRQMYHNDLHPGNIIVRELEDREQRGGDLIDAFVQTIAVDMGSVPR